jgi:MHS family alpha-ketoglutarate permease-like MFS transporter
MSTDAWSVGRSIAPLLGLNAFATYLTTTQAVVSPFLADTWALDDAGITFLAGVISLGAFGTVLLTRMADRRGRRRILLVGFVASLVLAVGSGLVGAVEPYALLQLLLLAAAGSMQVGTSVAVTEQVPEAARPVGHSWWGLAGALAGGLPFLLAPALAGREGGWRWMWLAAALMLVLAPAVRRGVAETGRFERAERAGSTERARVRDLFGERYGRRAVGLLLAGTLRPIALIATFTWSYYHMVHTLELSAGVASAIVIAGGGVGLAGNPLGARLAASWGRRPTLILGATVTVVTGIAFYFVPGSVPGGPVPGLALVFFVNQIGANAFGVADRCIDTELFPTALRATYAGMARLAAAVAAVACQFALSGLTIRLGGLPQAIAVLSLAAFLPSIPIFLWAAPETRGLSLDEASLEELAG